MRNATTSNAKRILSLVTILHAACSVDSSSPSNNNPQPQSSAAAHLQKSSSTTPRLPPGWWGELDDDAEDCSSSSNSESEYEGWAPFGASVSYDAPRTTPPSNPPSPLRETPPPKQSNRAALKRSVPSRPLQTLEKLQQMLDETDYMTVSPNSRSEDDEPPFPSDYIYQEYENQSEDPIFTNPAIQTESSQTMSSESTAQSTPRYPPTKTGDQSTSAGTTPEAYPDSSSASSSSAPSPQERLWTSKDRYKYKQQQRIRRQEEARNKAHIPSDDDSDTDDGLGYTLPNLPVYYSDAEGDSDTETQERLYQQKQQQRPPPPPSSQGTVVRSDQSAGYPYPPPPNPIYPPPNGMYYPPYPRPPPPGYSSSSSYPYPPYSPQQQQMMQQQFYAAAQQYAAWAAASGYAPPLPPQQQQQQQFQPQAWTDKLPPSVPHKMNGNGFQRQHSMRNDNGPREQHGSPTCQQQLVSPPAAVYPPVPSFPVELSRQIIEYASESPQSLAEAGSRINFDSIQKISLMLVTGVLACYAAVSPRILPLAEYNDLFYQNLRITSMAMIAPFVTFLSIFDAAQNDVNDCINSLYISFSVGYAMAFILEIIFTTLVRLAVFCVFEPDIFALTPKVPVLVLPWVLRENRYRPKRITLFAADFGTSCIACPIIEEYIKLRILQWSVKLPRNFIWVVKTKSSSTNKKKKKRRVAEMILRSPGEREVTTVNKYVAQMLATSIGLKIADVGRRILMYTKPQHADKSFYALCRGVFPIHELCGTMTALALARRDVLGQDMPLWKILAPAVVIHGMANFRGMKPLFKWNSATPWSEMQLSPWSLADASTFPQLLSKGFGKLMWLIILCRVLGYCIKNYYLINRQAVKRTTTYAGKHAAFSAELAAAEMLKNTKDKK